jgi:hypothetical protein
MSPKVVVNVHCKACGKDFERLDWMKNTKCDMPEKCHCPEVQKAMQKATQAINKARMVTMEKTVKPLPTQRDEDIPQLYLENVEPLVVIEIKRPNQGKWR